MRVYCGTDVVQIQRIQKAVDRQGERFLNRVYTTQELAICTTDGKHRIASLATRFAGKEALAKALGTGVGPFRISWTDLEILNDAHGAPFALLHGAARERLQALEGISVAISLSHEQDIAQAFCVILSSGDDQSNGLYNEDHR